MSYCEDCDQSFAPTFDGQRYCWDCWRERQDNGSHHRTSKQAKDDHAAYLASVDWRLHRAYRVQLAGGQCERCVATTGLQAHHHAYERAGAGSRHGGELLEDLEVLCRGCHEFEHDIPPEERTVKLPIDFEALRAGTATATVEVRTLTVGGKGMTIAVFRQLPQRSLVTSEGELAGDAWGTVNVCPSRDCPDPTFRGQQHRHVIWSAGGCLYSDVRSQPGRFEPYSDWADSWAVLAAADRSRRHLTWKRDGNGFHCNVRFVEGLPPVRCDVDDRDLPLIIEETAGKADPPPCTCKPYSEGQPIYHHSCGATWQQAQVRLEQTAAGVRERWDVSSIDEVAERVCEQVRDEHAIHQRHLERWEGIVRLPQLFLGVR